MGGSIASLFAQAKPNPMGAAAIDTIQKARSMYPIVTVPNSPMPTGTPQMKGVPNASLVGHREAPINGGAFFPPSSRLPSGFGLASTSIDDPRREQSVDQQDEQKMIDKAKNALMSSRAFYGSN